MKNRIVLLAFLFAAITGFAETPQTLRVDYYHTGNALLELFSLHQVVVEPLPWAGNPDRPIDDTNRGYFKYEIVEPVTGKVLYSRGFSSIFGEWQTTREAQQMNRTFHESVRFPKPNHPFRLRISKRDDQNQFSVVWTVNIDPDDMLVVRKHPPPAAELIAMEKNGDPANKVDLLILGDGYTTEESAKFKKQTHDLIEELFKVSPFKERRQDFNVWALMPPAAESGTNRPSNGTYRWSPSGTTYDAFRSERYVLAFDNPGFREICQISPYEFVTILANHHTYGGGGIYGLYSTVAAASDWAPYLFIHEFGHHFAALADEYYTSSTAYLSGEERPEPWEPNVTALLDPDNVKWKHLVKAGTPLPTPWKKQEFEAFQKKNQANRRKLRSENRPESEMNQLFRDEQAFVDKLLAEGEHAEAIGAFEGANYQASGYYRSEANCLMFTRYTELCKVCRDATEVIIDLYSK